MFLFTLIPCVYTFLVLPRISRYLNNFQAISHTLLKKRFSLFFPGMGGWKMKVWEGRQVKVLGEMRNVATKLKVNCFPCIDCPVGVLWSFLIRINKSLQLWGYCWVFFLKVSVDPGLETLSSFQSVQIVKTQPNLFNTSQIGHCVASGACLEGLGSWQTMLNICPTGFPKVV